MFWIICIDGFKALMYRISEYIERSGDPITRRLLCKHHKPWKFVVWWCLIRNRWRYVALLIYIDFFAYFLHALLILLWFDSVGIILEAVHHDASLPWTILRSSSITSHFRYFSIESELSKRFAFGELEFNHVIARHNTFVTEALIQHEHQKVWYLCPAYGECCVCLFTSFCDEDFLKNMSSD